MDIDEVEDEESSRNASEFSEKSLIIVDDPVKEDSPEEVIVADESVRRSSVYHDTLLRRLVSLRDSTRDGSFLVSKDSLSSRVNEFNQAPAPIITRRGSRQRLKRFKYNADVNYAGDIERPTLFQKKLTFTENPLWHNMIRLIIFVLIIMLCFDVKHLEDIQNSRNALVVVLYVFYTIDMVFSFLTQHILKIDIQEPNPIEKPLWVFAIELIALVPVEFFESSWTWLWVFLRRVKSVLLIIRLVYECMHDSQQLQTAMSHRIWHLTMASICLRVISGSIVFNLILNEPADEFSYVFDMKTSLQKLSMKSTLSIWQNKLPLIISIYLENMVILTPSICLMMFTYSLNNRAKYAYISNIQLFLKILVPRFRISENNSIRVSQYMQLHWSMRDKYMLLDSALDEKVCYQTTYVAMFQNRNLIALQHCPMLRDFEFYLLRYLSQSITARFFLKDKDLYKVAMRKMQMFYIASGEVDILSHEDGQSPIIKLTAGTCVGTAVLLRPYRSSSNFRTSTQCEIYELKTKDFCDFARNYPLEYRTCVKYLQAKIDQAIMLTRLKREKDPTAIDNNIIWLKRHLHRFMAMKAVKPNDHKVTNVYLMQQLENPTCDDVLYTKMNLDVLSIKARSTQYNDLVFIKPRCCWVLHPDSPILKGMWRFMLAMAIVNNLVTAHELVMGRTWLSEVVLWSAIVFMFVDILMLSMTPVNLNMPRKIWHMFAARCKQIGFVCDVISFVLAILLHLIKYDMQAYLLESMRLWRVLVLFWHLDNNTISHLFAYQLLFYISVYLFLWYNIGLILIWKSVSEKEIFSYDAIMLAIGQEIHIKDTMTVSSYYFSIPTYILLLFRIIIASNIASSYHLMKYDYISIASALASTERFIQSATVKKSNHSLTVRLQSFMTLLINDYQYLQLKNQTNHFIKMPDYIELIIKPEGLLKYMNRSQFFSKFPKDLVKELVAFATVETYYEYAIILTRGVRYKQLFILIEGQVCSVELQNVELVTKGTDFNILEIVFDTPSVRTFVALSDVLCAAIPYQKFLEFLAKFHSFHQSYLNTISELKAEYRQELIHIFHGKPMVVIEVERKTESTSFYTYKCIMFRDSFEAYDFFPAYDRLGLFSWVRFLLLRVTFHPEGRVFLMWERCRVTLVCIGAIIFLLPSYIQAPIENYTLAFDIMSYIDIYVRLHVCYYNSLGILVKHPLKTAKNYLFRAFLIDLLSVLPLQYYSDYTVFRTLIRSCRAIQLYRVFGYRAYTFNEPFVSSLLSIIYISMVIAVALATLIFEFDCTDSTVTKLTCEHLDTTSPIAAYLNVVLITTSAITNTYLKTVTNIQKINIWTSSAVSVTCLLGVFWRALCLAYSFNSFMIHDVHVNKTRTDIRKLVNFMKYNKLPKILRQHVLDYFAIQWKWYDVYRCREVIINMNTSLQRDFLFHVYGDPYIRFNTFTSDYRNLADFYKNVLLYSNSKVCPTYGKFITLNDIESSVYFVYRGIVEIAGPDGHPITTLLAGGIFGNLVDRKETRQRITATAKCNTQCLHVKSSQLYDILDFYPKIKSHFVGATQRNPWYIKSKAKSYTSYPNLTKCMRVRYNFLRTFLVFNSFASCYVGNILNFYQIATGEDNRYFLITLYILDGIHFLAEAFKFVTPTLNEFGYWCTSIKEIFAIRSSTMGIIFAIFTSLPLDVAILYGMPHYTYHTYLYSALRVNRVFRMYYIVVTYLNLMSESGTARTLWHKTSIIFYEVIYYTALMTTVFSIAETVATSYIYQTHLVGPETTIEDVIRIRTLSSVKKFKYFTGHSYFSLLLIVQQSDRNIQVKPPIMPLLASICLLLSFLMYLLVLCQIFDVITDIYARTAFLATIMFNNTLKHSKVYADYIKARVITNARYVYSKDNKRSMRALDQPITPVYLREMVLNSAYGHFLTSHPIFKFCHPDFLRQVGRGFKIVDIPKSCEVMHKFDHRRCMFFLLRGSIVMLQEDGDIIDNYVYLLKPGDCFCFQQGLNRQKQAMYTYTCRKSSTILELEYDSWGEIATFFPATNDILIDLCEKLKDEPFLTLELPKKIVKRLGIKQKKLTKIK